MFQVQEATLFNYQKNKVELAKLALNMDMTLLDESTSIETEKIDNLLTTVNEHIYFDQKFISPEMFSKYDVKLSSKMPIFAAGQITIVNENQEFQSFLETVTIENSNDRFLQEEFEYRPKVQL